MNRICFVSKALILSQNWTFFSVFRVTQRHNITLVSIETVTLRYHGSAKAHAHASYHVYMAEEKDDEELYHVFTSHVELNFDSV